MNKQIAFLTTIFETDESYLDDFFGSLSNQTYKNFDVIVVNDGYSKFSNLKIKFDSLSVIELPFNGTPVKNREHGINFCIKNGYNYLVLGDCDDYFSENRIEKSISLLEGFDIVVNDLSLFNKNGVYEKLYFSNRIKNNSEIGFDFIKNKNIFGLSNTAINLSLMSEISFPEDEKIVDWYFFKNLLKEGKTSIFTNEIVTFYRQHENNFVGLKSNGETYPLWWEK